MILSCPQERRKTIKYTMKELSIDFSKQKSSSFKNKIKNIER